MRVSQLHREWLKEPNYKRAFDALQQEFAIYDAEIMVRDLTDVDEKYGTGNAGGGAPPTGA